MTAYLVEIPIECTVLLNFLKIWIECIPKSHFWNLNMEIVSKRIQYLNLSNSRTCCSILRNKQLSKTKAISHPSTSLTAWWLFWIGLWLIRPDIHYILATFVSILCSTKIFSLISSFSNFLTSSLLVRYFRLSSFFLIRFAIFLYSYLASSSSMVCIIFTLCDSAHPTTMVYTILELDQRAQLKKFQ